MSLIPNPNYAREHFLSDMYNHKPWKLDCACEYCKFMKEEDLTEYYDNDNSESSF